MQVGQDHRTVAAPAVQTMVRMVSRHPPSAPSAQAQHQLSPQKMPNPLCRCQTAVAPSKPQVPHRQCRRHLNMRHRCQQPTHPDHKRPPPLHNPHQSLILHCSFRRLRKPTLAIIDQTGACLAVAHSSGLERGSCCWALGSTSSLPAVCAPAAAARAALGPTTGVAQLQKRCITRGNSLSPVPSSNASRSLLRVHRHSST